MRYCLDHEETICFEKKGYVLLQELLPQGKVQRLLSCVSCAFQENRESFESQKREAGDMSLSSFYARDVALFSSEVRKVLFSKSLGQIASQLAKKKTVRYGGDWLWKGDIVPWGQKTESGDLSSCFCVKPLALACLFALSDRESGAVQNDPFLPEKAGDALLFSPQLIYPWRSLGGQDKTQKFLLFLYAEKEALYTFNPLDPHTHALKRMGYVFGDRLKETTHPHLVR